MEEDDVVGRTLAWLVIRGADPASAPSSHSGKVK